MLSEDLYFAGRLIRSNNNWVVTDRLGSVVKSGTETLRYFPWGEERNTTTQNRDKFGAYFRDSTGLDYALNRYYSSSHGRFLTPDPYYSSAGPEGPQSWNRYAYVENDPVNKVDPYGLDLFWADSLLMFPGELGGIGGWGWGLPSWMDIWGLPWWMPFPAPPVLPAPPASAPPSAAAGSSAEPSGGQSCASQTTAGPFQDPFAQVAAAGFQQGMTQVMTMPCPVPIPQVCAVTTLIRVTVYAAAAAALLLDAIQRRGQSDPYTLPRVNPGRDAAGNCNPCPPDGPPWQDPGDAHGSTGGSHWHWIKYNQNPTTCECYPTRMDSPTRP
jgi:RHS repeat-associated protein